MANPTNNTQTGQQPAITPIRPNGGIIPTPQEIENDPNMGQGFLNKYFPQSTPQQKGYTPSFWENPHRVARYVLAQRAMPPGSTPPNWMDNRMGEVYDYLQAKNNNQPWYYWDMPDADDPVRQVMQSMALPPRDQVRADEQRFYTQPNTSGITANGLVSQGGTGQGPSGAGASGNVGGTMEGTQGGYQPAPDVKQDMISGMPADQFNQLNWWQKALRFGLPLANDAMMAQMGAKIGSTFGPTGALVGGAAGFALQPAIDWATEKDEQGNPVHGAIPNAAGQGVEDIFSALMWGAKQVQNSVGLLAEAGSSITNPDLYGNINEIVGSLDNLKAAYNAGALFYPYSGALAVQKGYATGDLHNPLPGKEGKGEALQIWDLEHPQPSTIQAPEGQNYAAYAMTQMRRQLLSDPTVKASDLEAQYASQFGIFGQISTMVGQMVLDPMHLLPKAETAAGEKLAMKSGNVELARSFAEGHDVLDATRRYGIELRQLPQDRAAQFGAVSRWIAGLDAEGNIKEMKPGSNNLLDRMRGLDPKSRANELMNTAVNGLGTMVHQFARDEAGNLDPDKALNVIETMAKTLPGQEVAFLDGSPAPRWFASAEGQAVSAAIREQMPVLREMLDQFKISRPNAQIVTRLAEAMGITPEKLIAQFHGADAKQAQDLFTQFRLSLERRAAAGDANATKLLDAFKNDPDIRQMTGLSFKKIADTFAGKDAIPFNSEHMVLTFLDKLEQGVSAYGVKYFGVKPDNAVMRFSELVKKAQGRVLLGCNPSYFINNAINNIVTMAWDGVMGLNSHAQIMKDMEDLGITATRLRQGIGAADMGELGGGQKVGAKIREAGRANDLMQKISDLMGRGQMLTPFTLLSGRVEQMSSEIAMHSALMDFWNRRWTVGDGFRKMSAEDRIALNSVEPGLAEKIERAVARGKNREQIEKEIFTGLQRKSVTDVLQPAEKAIIDNLAPGMLDKLDEQLKDAKADEDVHQAINDMRLNLEKAKTDMVTAGLKQVVAAIADKVGTEKTQGLLDEAKNIHQSFLQFWMQHSELMDDLAEKAANAKSEGERITIWNTGLREAGERWRQFTNIEGAKWLGMFEGLGAAEGSPEYEGYLQEMLNMHDIREGFFHEREQATVEYLTKVEELRRGGLDGKALSAEKARLWQQRGERLNKAYVDFLLNEDDIQKAIDDRFVRQYTAQFPDDPYAEGRARHWRDEQMRLRRLQAISEAVYRHGKVPEDLIAAWGASTIPQVLVDKIRNLNHGLPDWQLNPNDRPEIAKRFYNEVYRPIIAEMINSNHQTSPEMVDIPPEPPTGQPAAAAAQPQPAAQPSQQPPASVPVMITKEMRRRLKAMGVIDAEIRDMTPQQAWDRLNGNETEVAPEATERRVSAEQERRDWLLTHDNLTRLKNRYAFLGDPEAGIPGDFQKAVEAAAASGGEPPVVAMTDLRGLHQTNNNLGYTAGDAYLKALAKAFQDEGIDAYRYGGDEFTAIFNDAEQANIAMSRVMARLENAIIKVGDNEYVGAKAHFGIGPDPDAAGAAATAAKRTDANADIYERGTYQLQPRPDEPAGQAGEGNAAAEGLATGAKKRGRAPVAGAEPESGAPSLSRLEAEAVTRAENARAVTPELTTPQIEDWSTVPLQREDGTYDYRKIATLPNNDSEVLPPALADAIKEAAGVMLQELRERHPEKMPVHDEMTGEPVKYNSDDLVMRNQRNQIKRWIDDLGALESRKSAENSLQNIVDGTKGRSPKYDQAMREEIIKRLLGRSRSPYEEPYVNAPAAWLLGERDLVASWWDEIINHENAAGDIADPAWLGPYADQIQEYWIDHWIPEHAIEALAPADAEEIAAGMEAQGLVAIDEAGNIHTPQQIRQAGESNPELVRNMAKDTYQIKNPVDAHIMNIVKQVFPGVRKFDEISPEMAREAFERNKTTHAAVEQGKGLYTPTMQEVAERIRKNIAEMQLALPERGRDGASRFLSEMFPDEKVSDVLKVLDVFDRVFCREYDKPKGSFYNTFYFERGGANAEYNGATRWSNDGRAIITAYHGADVHTIIHESIHGLLPLMPQGDIDLLATWLKNEYGMDLPDGWHTSEKTQGQAMVAGRMMNEQDLVARAAERFVAEGEAPTPELQSVFTRLKNWMAEIYHSITGTSIDVRLDNNVRQVLRKWFGEEPVKPTAMAGPGPKQPSLFPNGEDLPIFSGTPQPAAGETFQPGEAARQESLWDMRPQIEPKKVKGEASEALQGAERVGDITPQPVKSVWQDPKQVPQQLSLNKLMEDLSARLDNPAMDFTKSGDYEAWFKTATGLDLSDEKNMNLAYDILEGAFNQQMRQVRAGLDARNAPLAERLKTMEFFEKRITKARRTIAKMKLQQFSTPLTISEAAGYAADVHPGDVILEPTAGTANLVDRFHDRTDVKVLVNEFDPGRRSVLTALGYDPTGLDLMGREWVVDDQGKKLPAMANVTITNPPWGAYTTGKYGKAIPITDGRDLVIPNDWSQRFTYLTMQRMPEGSRFVGVMPVNWLYTVDRTTRIPTIKRSSFFDYMDRNYDIRAVVESPTGAYDQRATGVGSLLIVIDKTKPGKSPLQLMAYASRAPKSWEEYASLVEQLANGGEYSRRPDEILGGQGAIPSDTLPGAATPRPLTGPDATGLVDPAARRGSTGPADATGIGKLQPAGEQPAAPTASNVLAGPEPATPTPAAAASAATPAGAAEGQPAAASGVEIESITHPLTRTAEPGRADELGGVLEQPGQQHPAGMEAGNAEQPGGQAGNIDPSVVEGYAPAVQGRIQRFMGERSEDFRKKYVAGADAAARSGSFTRYVGRSPLGESDPANLHPTVVVETKSLAGVKYPDLDPNYRPSPTVMKAYRNRVISLDGNLDPVWAAIQQCDKNGGGFLVADDVGMGKSRTASAFILDRIEKGKKRILYITKGEQNVDNIMRTELPGVYGGTVDENGAWIDVPKEVPFERLLLSGKTTPNVKAGEAPIPKFSKPAVYFVNDTQFADFSDAIKELQPDVVVVDEAHMFKSLDTKRAAAWNTLHQDWLSRNANMLYLSATPGTDLADLQYLYGLRVWTMDGFQDWVNIITGKESPEAVQARQADVDKLQSWSSQLADTRSQIDASPRVRRMGSFGEERAGYDIGENLWVGYSGQGKQYGIFLRNSGDRVSLRMGLCDSETEALIIADMISKSGANLGDISNYDAQSLFWDTHSDYSAKYPEPQIGQNTRSSLGIKDASDVIQKTEKGRKWGGGRSAFEYTIPPAHTEQIMRELKTGGYYMSRDIIRSGVDFNVKEARPSWEAIARFNKRVAFYRDVLQTFAQFAKENHGPKKEGGASFGVSGDIQADVKRQLFHMRIPGILKEADDALARGERVVISLVSVGDVDWEKGNLPSALSKINTLHVEKLGDGQFSDPEEIPEALIKIAELKEALQDLGKTPSPIDLITEHFGPDKVKAIIGDVSVNQRIKAVKDFQDLKTPVMIISGAGKTGINLHDVNGKARVHLIVGDYEWSSTTFKQELGRVDRTGQKSSPIVTVLHNGSAGEKKFLATISNRMKGLGAASKGAAESTGTGAMTQEFELGSDVDKLALESTWRQLTRDEKSMFLDSFFQDKNVEGAPVGDITGSAEAIKKFTKAIQSIPFDEANTIWQKFMDVRDALMGDENAENARLSAELETTKNYQGNVTRQTQLSGNLRLSEVKDEQGHKFAILDGILTPVMNKVKGYLVSPYDMTNSWMRWGRVYDPESKQYISGLVIPISKAKDLAEGFGQSIGGMHTIEGALGDLQAGDKIKIHGHDMHEWTLYLGRAGDREGKVIVDGAKMAQRDALLKNGAKYSAVGSYFWVPEDNLQDFLKRFQINNEAPKPPTARPTLYQAKEPELVGASPAAPQTPAAPAAGAPTGAMDSLSEAPKQDALLEGWGDVDNVLRKLSSGLTGPKAKTQGRIQGASELDPVSLKRVKGYLGQVYADMADTKMAALRYAEARRDFALLNYSRRTGADNMLGSLLPYSFWYTHSALNWAARALSRPGIISNYLKLNQFVQNATNQPGYPTRLKGKTGVYLPFLPKWMGESIYIDPMQQIYPYEQLMRPFTQLAQQKTLEEHEAAYVLDDQVKNGEITAQQAAEAKAMHQGQVWDQAYAQAVNQVAGNIQNPADFVFSLSGPLLPVTIAYDMMTGRKDQIAQLPATKLVQNFTSLLGIGGPQGVNIEAPIRKALDMPEMPFNDMRVGRMLSNMAAEGLISADDAERAMINKSGEAYQAAQKRVAQMGLLQYVGAPLATDLFPEGEQEQRQLQQEYGKALDAAKGGDKKALTAFYDKYPEYEARSMAFKDPQTQIKSFLISDVWNQYNALSALDKKQVSAQLGSTFQDAFLNNETRSYDSIPAETLAKWSQAMGGKPLDVFGKAQKTATSLDTAELPVKFADPKVAASYQRYVDTKKEKFGGISDLESMYYNLPDAMQGQFADQYPQLADYSKWNNAYLASHPEIYPYVITENSDLYGVDPKIQQQVYTFRASRAELFPNLNQEQNEYFALTDKGARKTYLAQHKDLKNFWNWRTTYATQHPEAAQYILSQQNLADLQQTAAQGRTIPTLSSQAMQQITGNEALLRQIFLSAYGNGKLSAGSNMALMGIWQSMGKPEGDYETWVKDVIKPTFQVSK